MITRRGVLGLGLFQTKLTEQQSKFTRIEVEGTGPTRLYMRGGAEPPNTEVEGVIWDAVLFVGADGSPKLRTRDGKLFAMPQL